MALRYRYLSGEIRLDYKILEYFRRLIYLLHPLFKEEIILFLKGPAQTADHIPFPDMGFMADSKAFPTWLLEMLNNPQIEFTQFSIYSTPPV